MSNHHCKPNLCLWINLFFKTHGLVRKLFLTMSGQGEVRDHQCSFLNTYTFENIIHIDFRYHKTRKYHKLSPTLVLTRVCRPCGDASWRHPNFSSRTNISHNHKHLWSRESSYLPIRDLYLGPSIGARSITQPSS